MSLIKCPECNKNISEECKYCRYCGYKLRKETFNIKQSIINVFKENKTFSSLKISSMQILSLVSLVCSLYLSNSEICFSRVVYPSGQTTPSQVTISNFFECIEYMPLSLSIILVWMMLLSVPSIILFNSKFNFFKKKEIILVPNAIYAIMTFVTITLSCCNQLKEVFPHGIAYHEILWGAVYVTILAILSFTLLIINNKKLKLSEKEQ